MVSFSLHRGGDEIGGFVSGSKMRKFLLALHDGVEKKIDEQFGFRMRDITFTKVVQYLHAPKDPSSLAITRILFGLIMLFDIPDERGGANMDRRWGNPSTCHFPLLPFVQALPMPYMSMIYALLWVGAVGMMIGYKYRISSVMFTASYWYLILIEKSFWNNHSYLFGLVGLLLTFTDANCYWSLDAYLKPSERRSSVPYWNYFILKFQFFILYTMAGLKKGSAEWLTGYSVQRLSEHWVFGPFKLFLTVPQIDYIIVHWFIFVFDLTVAVWMMWAQTRHVAMFFCALFHLMNSRLFRIGMFPWVCLATMPLFYPFDWPKLVQRKLRCYFNETRNIILHIIDILCDKMYECPIGDNEGDYYVKNIGMIDEELETEDEDMDTNGNSYTQEQNMINKENIEGAIEGVKSKQDNPNIAVDVNEKKKITVYLIILYVLSQLFLPYSHFITKGYNNWTNGLYGYSWDMMVHSWDVSSVVVKVIDHDNKVEYYVDPFFYTLNDRWTRHGDMVYQYAQCLRDNLIQISPKKNSLEARNMSIKIDVWCSMNGRFIQRLFDPKVDLLRADWSPWKRVPYLLPLLDEAIGWRKTLADIREHVNSWSQDSNVMFLADLPGFYQEKFIPMKLRNVTLTVLEGSVAYVPEATTSFLGSSYPLTSGNRIAVHPGFHRVLNFGDKPAYYMYTFYNSSRSNVSNEVLPTPKLPIFVELNKRFQNMFVFGRVLYDNIYQIFFCKVQCY